MIAIVSELGQKLLPKLVFSIVRRAYIDIVLSCARFRRWAKSFFYLGTSVECPFCGGHFRKFLPTGVLEREFWSSPGAQQLLAEEFVTVCNLQCPRCGSSERHRLAFFYLQDNLRMKENQGARLLDVAPDAFVTKALFQTADIDYVSIDLVRSNADYLMDITDLQFDDDSFDVIVCYHVLEHIKEDRQAMGELYRVLKPGGWAILQVPIWARETYEDDSVPREKFLKHYGHKDHVRTYGLDFKERLQSSGFQVKLDQYVRMLPEEVVNKFGLLLQEDIFRCEKPVA